VETSRGAADALKIQFFRSPAELQKWFEKHHAAAVELWVGYYKKGSGKASVTWPESVDEALCVGWIDGVRKSIDEARYKIRFTPRKRGSTWSNINIKRCQELAEQGRMQGPGLKAFEARRANKSGIYAYEQRRDQLEEPYQGILKKNKAAWDFFQAQPPGYRKTLGWWVISAKQEETRLKRLKKLIDASVLGKRL
jgi:uncharacterized protein YdeI (YjbR/CyaY-like superfamily)